jgi:hypothetical protein
MSLKQILKNAGAGMAAAALLLVVGLAGEVAWLALGLPGVHRAVVAPETDVAAGTPSRGPAHARATVFDRSDTLSESDAEISSVPAYGLAVMGLIVGFRWAYVRDLARARHDGSHEVQGRER